MANNNKDKVLNAPPLRFPEFSGEWANLKLNDCCTFFSGGTPSSSKKEYYNGGIPFIRSGEIHSSVTELSISQKGLVSSAAKIVDEGDLLLALYGATSGEIDISKIKGAINQAILCIRSKQNTYFLKSIWEKHCAKILRTYLQGGQGNLSAEIVRSICFAFPCLEEQDKIAKLLFLIDKRIATQIGLIDKLQSLISGIIQYAVKDGLAKQTWKKTILSTVLAEHKELNTNMYSVYSVSVSEGVVNQIEYLGRSFAAKDTSHYHVVKYGDIVYTKSPTGDFPFGIVKQSMVSKPVAVSPLYGVYKPVSIDLGLFLHYYFMSSVNANNYLQPLIQKGAKNTINIGNQRFLENMVPLPLVKDNIKSLSHTLTAIQRKIDLEKFVLSKLQKQRLFLLSNMFI